MQDVLYTVLPLIVLLFHFAVPPSQLRARPRVEPVIFQRVSTPCPQLARKASFLCGVQSRPEFVRSDELVSVQGAADGNKKTCPLKFPPMASTLSPCFLLCVPSHKSFPSSTTTLIKVVSLACQMSLNPLGMSSRLLFRCVPPSRPLCLPPTLDASRSLPTASY